MTRRQDPLVNAAFDVLVVGGGIVGACAARDAVRRGFSVALIERDDFGGGISWNSLKILHGGLRSLQGLNVPQARRFVHERRAWLRVAPHLVDPLPVVVPTRGLGGESAMLMRAGLALNDLVASDRNRGVLPSRRLSHGRALSAAELRTLVPWVSSTYSGGALFYDAQLYSAERLVYEVLSDAERAGAVIANRVEAVAPLHIGGTLGGVAAEDRVTGARFDVRASMIINAAGASASGIACVLTGREDAAPRMSGIALNLMLEGDGGSSSFVLASRVGGRLRRLFVVPWRGRTLVGTAHYECERPPESKEELEPYVEMFVREVASAWPAREITRESVLLVHAGMQPSAFGSAGTKAHGPPEHLIIDHAHTGTPQLLTAVGPKLTTSRWVAEQLIDLASGRLRGRAKPCDTDVAPLASSPREDIPGAIAAAFAGDHAGLPEDVVAHLVRWYGSGENYESILRIANGDPAMRERIDAHSPVIAAQLRFAAMMERVTSSRDIIDRRTELGSTARGSAAALRTAQAEIDRAAAIDAAGQGRAAGSLSATPESRSL